MLANNFIYFLIEILEFGFYRVGEMLQSGRHEICLQ